MLSTAFGVSEVVVGWVSYLHMAWMYRAVHSEEISALFAKVESFASRFKFRSTTADRVIPTPSEPIMHPIHA